MNQFGASTLMACWVLFAAAVGAAADIGVPPPVRRGWSEGTDWREVITPYLGGGLETAVIPTPRSVTYSDRMLRTGKGALVIPDHDEHPNTLRDLKGILRNCRVVRASEWKDDPSVEFLVAVGNAQRNPVTRELVDAFSAAPAADALRAGGAEAYLLFVTTDHRKRTIIVLSGRGPVGDFWAVQTLRQLVFRRAGATYVLGVWMLDWPTFSLRGSKEMRNYMPRYKDNFSWGAPPERRRLPHLLANFCHYIPCYAPGGTLDCSGEALDRLERQIRSDYASGARSFAVKFDDVPMNMTPESAARFDTYPIALRYFMHEVNKRVKAIDPSCKLYYLPQCYHSNSDYRAFARGIRDAGGLPPDAGLCWTGPDVFSRVLPVRDVRDYMRAFGLTRTRGIIYDNYARHGDYFPIPRQGRPPSLARYLDGIFSENSTRLNRITRCDYNWNPEAYEPGRALKLACREIARRKPDACTALYDFVVCYEANRCVPRGLPRPQKIEHLRAANARLEGLLRPLQRLMPPGNDMIAEAARAVHVRLSKQSKLMAAGFREGTAVRAGIPPVIDGTLDDACWRRAPALTDFVNWDQSRWQELGPRMGAPVTVARQTVVRIAYDDHALYLAAQCKADRPFRITRPDGTKPWWATDRPGVPDTRGIWHSPSVEFFLAPTDSRDAYFHLIVNIAGLTFDQAAGRPEQAWNSGWETRTRIEGNAWFLEAAIPLVGFGVRQIRKGDTWAVNICRTEPGRQMWTFVWGPGGFHTPEDFGTLRFQ